ncbi:MAG: tetratricopeptide repeat protein [Actinobacteria bacterium]|nr:tetratricopeptide repeat protein [Actinomycetota bacterium]
MSLIEEGWQLFAEADWRGARDAFAAALADDPGDPHALDGLGQASWWLGERERAIETRREAYLGYRKRGEVLDGARVAIYLAGEERIDGRRATAAGWLARARRLLAGLEVTPEAGWLAIEEAKSAPEAGVAETHARTALDVAHRLGDHDVECMALAQLGRALVRQGRVADGVALLDEAMAIALGGESSDPLACGDACCTALATCEGLADVRRSAEWCESVVDFTERRRFVPSRCSRGAARSTPPCSCGGATGSGLRPCSWKPCAASRATTGSKGACLRSRRWPSCGSGRAAWKRRRRSSRESPTTPPSPSTSGWASGAARSSGRGRSSTEDAACSTAPTRSCWTSSLRSRAET